MSVTSPASTPSTRQQILGIDNIESIAEPDNDEMKTVLAWIDEQTFSRPKKHLHRDFSDGVLVAELIHHFLPKLVELHNYVPASAVPAKKNNWKTLNRKVFSKLEFTLSDTLMEFLATSRTGAIELVLKCVYDKIDTILEARARKLEMESKAKKDSDYGGTGDGSGMDRICKVFGEQDLIVYNGSKYVCQKSVEEKQRKIECQDQELKELRNKVKRLETLVSLKDDRLNGLTSELHQAHQKKRSRDSINQNNCPKK